MASWSNYDDVLGQLRDAELIVDKLEIGTTRPVRCKVDGDREKRGWYRLYELPTTDGDLLIVGSYGVWRGDDNGIRKIELRKREISVEQRDALKRRLADDKKKIEAARKREAERAASTATAAWAKLSEDGESTSGYLAAKRVRGYGLRYTSNGSAVVPLTDATGRIHGLQFLRTHSAAEKARRPAKEFWPRGLIKKGHFHLIGSPATARVTIIVEGYATGASILDAMRGEVALAVAFDAGNIEPVAVALRKHYRQARILIAADDDILGKCADPKCRGHIALPLHPVDCPACGQPHKYNNAGVNAASAAVLTVSGAWAKPEFPDQDARISQWLETSNGGKLSDFNDLHTVAGLRAVADQLSAKLSELGWDRAKPAAPAITSEGGGGGDKLRPIHSVGELIDRYALVYAHSSAVFDRQEHMLLSVSDMRDICIRRELHRAWAEHPDRNIVRIDEVGFDPGGDDPSITCNLWGGWPTTPKAGRCDKLLEVLRHMCSGDREPEKLFQWVLRWVALPIQRPGAKMKTTIVVHGPQGTGKNLFFEAVMSVYGKYGDVIDQSAVEDKFNDWASRKLFMIADEVVARSDLYHVKNKLKALITGNRIRINPKNFAAYWEANHLNVVFLSNETMPVVLEEDDRRHCIIWTPPKREPEFYKEVLDEIANGGVAALHEYLLNVDLGDFHVGSPPPLTEAKSKLVDLGLDSPSRFYYELFGGEIEGVTSRPAKTLDLFELYRLWCNRANYKPAPMNKFVAHLERKHGAIVARKRYMGANGPVGPHGVMYLAEYELPPGESESAWLGKHVAAFAAAVEYFRGGDA